MKVVKMEKYTGVKNFITISKAVKELEGRRYYKKGIVEKLLKQGHQLHSKTHNYQLVLTIRELDALC